MAGCNRTCRLNWPGALALKEEREILVLLCQIVCRVHYAHHYDVRSAHQDWLVRAAHPTKILLCKNPCKCSKVEPAVASYL